MLTAEAAVPLTVMDCGEFAALSVKVSKSERIPTAEGKNQWRLPNPSPGYRRRD